MDSTKLIVIAVLSFPPAAPAPAASVLAASVLAAPILAAPAPGVTLTASLDGAQYSVGTPVILSVALHNGSSHQLDIGGTTFERASFHWKVTDATGRPIHPTAFGMGVMSPRSVDISGLMFAIMPGQTCRFRFNLARMFDLSRTGVVTVQVSQTMTIGDDLFSRSPAPHYRASLSVDADPVTLRIVDDAAEDSRPVRFTPPRLHRTFLYMATQDYRPGGPGDPVLRYRIEADGAPSMTLAPPQTAGPRSASIVVSPNGRSLYVANSNPGTVSQFRIGAAGLLEPLLPPEMPALPDARGLVMDPFGRFAYALGFQGSALFSISSDGRLTQVALMQPAGRAVDLRREIFATDFGVINPTATRLFVSGNSTFGYWLGRQGQVKDGSLIEDPPVSGWSHTGGTRLILSPSGRFAFLMQPTPSRDASGKTVDEDTIAALRVDPDGSVVPLPSPDAPAAPTFVPSGTTAMVVDPAGRYRVVANRGGNIACYRIGLDGSLTFVDSATDRRDPIALLCGRGPIVYVLHGQYTSITTFRLNDQGKLTRVGQPTPLSGHEGVGMALAEAPTPEVWGPASGGLKMSARLNREVFVAGAPVVLNVRIKNVTSHAVSLGEACSEMAGFRIDVSRGGYPVSLLNAGRDLLEAGTKRGVPLLLPSDCQRQYRFVLSRLADLTAAFPYNGPYKVRVRRSAASGSFVDSPAVCFRIDEPEYDFRRDPYEPRPKTSTGPPPLDTF